MYVASELLCAEQKLVDRAGRAVAYVLAYYRECTPQGVGLESHDYLCTAAACHVADKAQIGAQAVFVYYKVRSREVGLIHDRIVKRANFRRSVRRVPVAENSTTTRSSAIDVSMRRIMPRPKLG